MKKKFDFNGTTTKATVIDCLDCENYYTGACDGNAGGCNDYKPTRTITLERDISLIKGLTISTWIFVVGLYLAHILNAF